MNPPNPKDPLHGVTLERVVTELSAHYGWAELGRRVPVTWRLRSIIVSF